MYIFDLTLNFIAKLRCTLNWTVSARTEFAAKFFREMAGGENEKQNKRNSTAWTLEIGTNVPSFKFTRQTRQVLSFRLSLQLGTHMYLLHSPNPHVPSCTIFLRTLYPCSEHCFYAQLGTTLLCTARNIASMHSSEQHFFACFYAQLGTLLLCTAQNTASVPSSEQHFYAQLGTLLLCIARNPASMHSSEHCFSVQLGTLVLCISRNNTASLLISSFTVTCSRPKLLHLYLKSRVLKIEI